MTLGREKKEAPQNYGATTVRGIRYTSAYCLQLSRTIWEWLVASLPLDLAIVYLRTPPSEGSPQLDSDLLMGLLLIVAAGLFREQLFSLVERLRTFQTRLAPRHVIWLLIGMAVIVGAEVAARIFFQPGSLPVLFILAAGIVAAVSAVRGARTLKREGERFLRDRFAQVEQANTLHLGLVAAPMVAARALGAACAFTAAAPVDLLVGTVGAALALLTLYPRDEDFMAPCPRCSRLTSRVVKTDGCCPLCSPDKFIHRPK